MTYRVVVIPGDGIGPEVVAAALGVLSKAAAKGGINIEYEHGLAGGAALDRCGEPLPAATVAAAKSADAVLLGAVGGPKWDDVAPHLRAEKAILGLRKALGLYANLRPVRVWDALAPYSPLKAEAVVGTDILIVRELSGGIYYGARQEAHVADAPDEAWDTEIYTAPEIERIVRVACRAARLRRKRVTSVDKANVLATSRLWRTVAERTAAAFPEVRLDHLYVDNCAMQLVLAPKNFDVIVTSNLFGDILSDEAAVLAGSIGLLPSASLGDGPGLYEPVHGSAPDIAGQGIANPIGCILSAAMLLRHSLGEGAAADAIEQAVAAVLAEGYRTADLYRPGLTRLSTEEMARRIEEEI
ncbi:3-isopropylmalate dehydrogenase [Sporolituus thermophilus]|uniref:3-isopropylmalate dehydrogenase n=1 Tax=Sporolituus thermophilus DSM 23256 TaxID=1123285 RepID=A0A1G7NIU6_9FIRM|nr:3-isopropylmalate dehydrogenase [Sporolituus thermophilus]SDF74035.1 3-isopropylmalate dehydrogenase [Sporolituus thermophilus DSM 23256]